MQHINSITEPFRCRNGDFAENLLTKWHFVESS